MTRWSLLIASALTCAAIALAAPRSTSAPTAPAAQLDPAGGVALDGMNGITAVTLA
jgi:hypothetical protein